MAVYIKGMEIPKEGYVDVRLFSDGRATTQTGEHPFYREMKITEVKPHGRLIDADAIIQQAQKYEDEGNTFCLDSAEELEFYLDDEATTIIERSEDG